MVKTTPRNLRFLGDPGNAVENVLYERAVVIYS